MKIHTIKIIKIQSLARGWVTRKHNAIQIQTARWNAIRKSKKWILITKLQAHIKGFLHRKRKEKGLKNIKSGLDHDSDDELNDLTDFFNNDIRAKGENFDKELVFPENEEMKGLLNILNKKPKASLPPIENKPIVQRQHSDISDQALNRFQTDTNPNATSRSNNSSKNLSEINRKMLKNNNDYMHGAPDIHFFHAAGRPPRDRSPTSVSGAITEIDLNSEKNQLESGMNSFYNNNQPVINNLMNQSRGSFTGSQHTKKVQELEQKRKYVESWGVQNEESKKIIEARYMKLAKLKNKKKVLTADERLQQFKKIAKKK